MKAVILFLVVLVGSAYASESAGAPPDDAAAGLEADLENVRLALGIPGMAAAVVQDQELVWSAGFGYADLEDQTEATPATPFGLASVTKPIAATLVMQLVAEGSVELDALVSSYGVDLPDGDGVTVRHLLTHTSEGTPGTVHNYNGDRYGYLGGVIEGATGRTFSDLLGERILLPLEMMDTALNPINSWGGSSGLAFEEFGRALGWGKSFDHYPDVYARLAKPYQFDEDYSVIPGMYHLIHNPAAGGMSSVADLAKFDIALDTDGLLDRVTRDQMLAPAIPTLPGSSDMAYGLGWYVQDLDGLRLIWHTGRWPPSTSALYLKVPELDLTFIVLANTDNLTVPFPGIGSGDIGRSLPALTFFHHFVFPQQRGVELPEIDWFAGPGALVDRLASIANEEVAEFLERELWSYRQAFASSGQFERADALATVVEQAFPRSSKRFDSSYITTVGKTPIEDRLPHASSFGQLARLTVAWLAAVAVTLVVMAIRVLPARDGPWSEAMVWLVGALLVGPIALAVHFVVKKQGDRQPLSQILGASVFSVAGYGVAWVVAIWLLLQGGDEPNPLLTLGAAIVIPVVGSLLLVRAPLLMRAGVVGFGRAARRGFLAEAITWAVGLAVFFSMTFYIDNSWLSTIPHPTSPYFGAMISMIGVVGLIALVPLHWVLQRRGFTIWPTGAQTEVKLPRMRDSWWVLLASLVFMVAGIAYSVGSFG